MPDNPAAKSTHAISCLRYADARAGIDWLVDALHARAVAAGARIVVSLRDTDYGSHDFGCADPEGNFWGFGTYAPS